MRTNKVLAINRTGRNTWLLSGSQGCCGQDICSTTNRCKLPKMFILGNVVENLKSYFSDLDPKDKRYGQRWAHVSGWCEALGAKSWAARLDLCTRERKPSLLLCFTFLPVAGGNVGGKSFFGKRLVDKKILLSMSGFLSPHISECSRPPQKFSVW